MHIISSGCLNSSGFMNNTGKTAKDFHERECVCE
jgi:hypothetical protein